MGTWIEIGVVSPDARLQRRRSLRGNVDRNATLRLYEKDARGRSLRGNVDRNRDQNLIDPALVDVVPYVGTWIEIFIFLNPFLRKMRRSLRGNVDRNEKVPGIPAHTTVVPYVGTWIEMIIGLCCARYNHVVPYVGTWIEMMIWLLLRFVTSRRSLRGNVDRNCSSCHCHDYD